MKVSYIQAEKPSMKENNIFQSIPVMVEACCPDSVLWLFRNIMDFEVSRGMFIIRNSNTQSNFADFYPCCQFCGARHTSERLEKDNLVRKEEKENK